MGRAIRLVSCHLGGSSSLCAIDGGRSIDTTMGFSPQSGLENATRHGDLDVFAVLYMMERHGLERRGSDAAIGAGRRASGSLRYLRRRRARYRGGRSPWQRLRRGRTRRFRLRGEEKHRRLCRGDGRS